MKITKSMFYNPSPEARELFLCADNNGLAYPQICAVVSNLARKYKKGIFNAEQATVAFFHIMTAEAKRYARDFGYMFSVTERWTAAADMLTDQMDNIKNQATA